MRQRRVKTTETKDLPTLLGEHQNLEVRLKQLDKHRSLSPEEQYEIQVIKKRKLALKDLITALERA